MLQACIACIAQRGNNLQTLTLPDPLSAGSFKLLGLLGLGHEGIDIFAYWMKEILWVL